ncbi:MAG: dephospho-CoA kinase [Bacteroidales bacterium]|nr:dephospho-CoA kinase [Bacteroidales bacterium]
MKKIAITGGIGTGKTYISKKFLQMGIPVFYADEEAKKCYEDREIVDTIRSYFGTEVFTEGRLDFKKMARCVFQDPQKREVINKMIHPRVMGMFDEWAEEQHAPSVMLESAIVYENELEKFFDMVIVVDAPLEVRLDRIKKRNPNLTHKEIMDRINAQMPQEEKCRRADMVIVNRG